YLQLAFLWQDGTMAALPTLGGNNASLYNNNLNNHGQVAGWAENSTQDPNCISPQVVDWEAVIWGPKEGEIHELPPLPGDSIGAALAINDNGQVVGTSGACGVPSFTLPLQAVLWQNGKVIKLGSLGGALGNVALGINNRGQVVGVSDLPGDTTSHAFFWTKERGMQDLGTLPGDYSSAAYAINNEGQVVVQSCDVDFNCRVALWQNGVMTDLNALTPPGSLYLVVPAGINDLGEITGQAFDPSTGDAPAFLATPECEGDNTGANSPAAQANGNSTTKVVLPEDIREQLRQRRGFGRLG